MFKFVHAADLHLDSPLRGLSAWEDAPVDAIRSATRRALNALVDLCIRERVAFLIIAGDVYDGDWPDYSTGLFFSRCMARLQAEGIRVFLIRGNHDAASQITKRLVLPDNVVEFPAEAPQTCRLDELGVAIHGQSFAQRETRENLALAYPAPIPGAFNIGVLHTSAEGQEGHETYAPCRVDDLVHKGYDYWALGHIHRRQILHERPFVVYPGNLQGRNIRETGEKGCTLVTVDGDAVRLEHRTLDVLRWYVCEVNLTGARTEEDFLAAVCGEMGRMVAENPGSPLALRVRLTGRTSLHGRLMNDVQRFLSEVRNAAQMTAGDDIWVEKVKVETLPETRAAVTPGQQDALAALLASVASAGEDDTFLDDFLRHARDIQNRMGSALKSRGIVWMESREDVAPLLADAEALLLSLLGKEAD
ncbi:DNA repair exonuclease [Alicyclobacillus sp.]|uniref:metallophosphoesterase family protein n=1 Tax=Alicyclobacillus sp. TaxID=61169 RepID=UPI0025C690CA|nr:DNA repair exonuclease [Alicyclobacillus sp.]MCL6516530.1 DNA repair exonuclease [Alicyclobacillus sp.]